jgi:hypothetical protein
LASDGRKWRKNCESRHALFNWLATFADGDGTRVFPGIPRMMKAFEWSHGKVCYLLDELKAIGCLENIGLSGYGGTANRVLHPEALELNGATAHGDVRVGVQHSEKESNIEEHKESNIQEKESNIAEKESNIGEKESNVRLDATVTVPSPKPSHHTVTGIDGLIEALQTLLDSGISYDVLQDAIRKFASDSHDWSQIKSPAAVFLKSAQEYISMARFDCQRQQARQEEARITALQDEWVDRWRSAEIRTEAQAQAFLDSNPYPSAGCCLGRLSVQ